jgi:hypothetical protein
MNTWARSQGKDGRPQGKGAHRDPGGEPVRGRDKAPEEARDKGEERSHESGK